VRPVHDDLHTGREPPRRGEGRAGVAHRDPVPDAARTPGTDRTVGIDLGLTSFAVLSDGTKIDSPRFLRRAEKKLKKTQRELSRRRKGSRNRAEARLEVARVHAKVSDARREFLHQVSTKLIRDNQAIGVEDLAVEGLAHTRPAKSVHDAGWAQFIDMLEYKAARYGRTLIKIGRFTPTSRTCGAVDGPEPLDVRERTCTACGTTHDRDTNAALNIKTAAGPAASACGAQVRPEPVPAQREETGSHGFPTGNRAAQRHGHQSRKAGILVLQGEEHVNRRARAMPTRGSTRACPARAPTSGA
jgi:putative transposase